MSTTHVDHLARMREEMVSITKPLTDHYAELEKTIAEMTVELDQLRKARAQLARTLRSIDPELVPSNGRGRPKTLGNTNPSSPATLKALTDWLQARRDELNANGGIHASGIINGRGEITREDWDLPIRNASKLSQALRTLHDQGVIRLDHTGSGGAKYFKVV